jgi:hypothetical protein
MPEVGTEQISSFLNSRFSSGLPGFVDEPSEERARAARAGQQSFRVGFVGS